MTPATNSLYSTYQLSETELIEGTILSFFQQAVLQNMRMLTIEQKLSLTPASLTEDGKESYWQQEAYLRGQLDILTHLLQASEAAQTALAESQQLSTFSNNSI